MVARGGESLVGEFSALRGHLLSVVYRLTGSVADAEDAVQEAWLRLSTLPATRREEIRDLRAWATTVVSRIALDRLRSATARRESYIGEWLPEPIVTPLGAPAADDPLDAVVRDDGVRMAAMVVLDTLTPQQRVAFVLHDVFDVPFSEIADLLGCTPAAARQHSSRGRRAVAEADPPPRADPAEQRAVLDEFVTALTNGDLSALTELLHPEVSLTGDSDGKGRTARRVMTGADTLVRFVAGLLRRYRPGFLDTARPVLVNGDVGLHLPAEPGGDGYRALDEHVQAVVVRHGRIVALYDVVNPDKLTHVPR
ncbi:RNA polymerase sigma factor SigJ [Saccharomonospora iraqiensis]|uniref:RNA polymerase sigma factor SigJ n=1 Tax=Saccharomonospora iraqiensis TaxID=52698 RepID=UPI00041B24E2|nr:RNA polymerase sigma factor SigJ [Saccharomonospora iraqiensis]